MFVGIFDIFDFRAVPIICFICYLFQLILYMGGLSLIINCFICYYVLSRLCVFIYMCICAYMCPHVFTCGRMCPYMCYYYLSIGDFVTVHVLCWSCTCIVVGTQCGLSPLCVVNFLF